MCFIQYVPVTRRFLPPRPSFISINSKLCMHRVRMVDPPNGDVMIHTWDHNSNRGSTVPDTQATQPYSSTLVQIVVLLYKLEGLANMSPK